MDTEFKPPLLSLFHKGAKQVTHGKHLTLWEPNDWSYISGGGAEVCLTLRLKKSEIATASGAVSFLLAQIIMGTLGRCEIEPEDGEFFSITWPTYIGLTTSAIPTPIEEFLEEFSLISPEHKQEVVKLREWVHSNHPLPF